MRTPDGRGFLPDSIAERDRARSKSIDVLKRRSEKPAVPVKASGGGATDITRVWAYDLTLSRGATNTTVYPTSLEVEQLTGENTLVTVAADAISVTDAGIYLVKLDGWLAFELGDTATYARYFMDHEGSNYHFPRHTVPILPDLLAPAGSGPDAVDSWLCGPFAIPAGGSLEFGAYFDDTVSTPAVNYWSIDVTKIG